MYFFSCLNTAAYFLAKVVNNFLYSCPNPFLILPKLPGRTENILTCFLSDTIIKSTLIPADLKHPECYIFVCFISSSITTALMKLNK